MIYIPIGFAHGFCTLEDNTEISYKISGQFELESARGILWNDRDLGIDWPIGEAEAVLSSKDAANPLCKDCTVYFKFGEKT